MRLNLKQYCSVVDNVFTLEQCTKIQDSVENSLLRWEDRAQGFRESKVKFLPHSTKMGMSLLTDRRAEDNQEPTSKEFDGDWIYDRLFEVLEKEKKKKWRTFKLTELQRLQYTVYYAPEGHYNWHTDTGPPTTGMSARILTTAVQISDPKDHDGGSFEIAEGVTGDLNKAMYSQKPSRSIVKTLNLKQGSAAIFPSFIQHRVTKLTRGRRASLIGWCQGSFI